MLSLIILMPLAVMRLLWHQYCCSHSKYRIAGVCYRVTLGVCAGAYIPRSGPGSPRVGAPANGPLMIYPSGRLASTKARAFGEVVRSDPERIHPRGMKKESACASTES